MLLVVLMKSYLGFCFEYIVVYLEMVVCIDELEGMLLVDFVVLWGL